MFVINVIFVVHIYTSTRYMRVNVYFNKRNENENENEKEKNNTHLHSDFSAIFSHFFIL